MILDRYANANMINIDTLLRGWEYSDQRRKCRRSSLTVTHVAALAGAATGDNAHTRLSADHEG